jgi:hypothetical protein
MAKCSDEISGRVDVVPPKNSTGAFLTFEQLLEELKSPDDIRREAALVAAHRCKQLVDLRVAANSSFVEVEWATIFDFAKLTADIDSNDPTLAHAAGEVLDEIMHVAALRASYDSPTTLEERLRASECVAKMRHEMDEYRKKMGYAPSARLKN